jgi:hypothetical protein
MVNTKTKEVAIGSCTCLASFDLRKYVPLVLVDFGAAAAQSIVDSGARNRKFIRDEMMKGTPPAEIIELLSDRDSQHQSRQYGIVDLQGRSTTFTGSGANQWAGGVTGVVGDIVYAIQGNILTGACVVEAAESAVVNTPGTIIEKLMAGMEAARAMGGDGRCSCPGGDPTRCGCPPDSFTKSAHCGFIIATRPGDTDGAFDSNGTAQGSYYMNHNVAGADSQSGDPDPVYQLRDKYDLWRASLIGHPDGLLSSWTLSDNLIPADGVSEAILTFRFKDWQGTEVRPALDSIEIQYDLSGNGVILVGPVSENGDGSYSCVLRSSPIPGRDVFRIVVHDSIRDVTVSPFPEVFSYPLQPRDILPQDFTILYGSLVSGGLSQLGSSDDQRLEVSSVPQNLPAALVHLGDVRIGFVSRWPNVVSLALKVESRNSLPGSFQELRLFNIASQKWDLVHSDYTDVTDKTALVADIKSPSDYFDAARRASLRVIHRNSNRAAGFTMGIDAAILTAAYGE